MPRSRWPIWHPIKPGNSPKPPIGHRRNRRHVKGGVKGLPATTSAMPLYKETWRGLSMFTKPRSLRALALLIGIAVTVPVATAVPVDAKTKAPPLTHLQSFAVFDNNGAPAGNSAAQCNTGGCANGIQFNWSAGACVNGDHFSPVVVVFTINHKVAPNTWPMVAPCSNGIQLTWDNYNHLSKALWTGSSAAAYGLAICFQHAGQCGQSICVTNGCVPKNANGVDIFFEGDAALTSASWLRNGATAGAITVSGAVNDVYWYGSTPPASPFARNRNSARPHVTGHLVAPPRVVLLGRSSSWAPQTTAAVAPSSGHDVNFKWFLSPAGRYKQCIVVNGVAWTNPPMEFAYTTDGVLNSRVSVLTCAKDATGATVFYNGIDFSWGPSTDGTENNLYSAVPTFNAEPMSGLPADLLPQPPAGTDGLIFEFHHDDYDQISWPPNPAVLVAPGHPRVATFMG